MADEELRRFFAKRLSEYLEACGYNQADLARKLHVSTATTAKWCTGQTMPRIDKIQTICDWLGVEKSDLLDEKDVYTGILSYYRQKETAALAQELFDNKDLRVLFDAARGSRPEDIQMAAEMLRRFKEGRKYD